ncbi:MAG: hypothetical protein HYV95_01685 [Opitutae bacterium]|nr:hypothetical protein [Opitutae bacterium]
MSSAPPVFVPWFKRFGWFYRPVHVFGWITSLVALAFAAQVFVVIDRQSHSVTDTLYHFYTYAAPTFLGLMWIASRTSGENRGAS